MPCYDPRDSAQYIEKHELQPLRKQLAEREAMLCAIMTVLEGPVGMYIEGETLPMVLNRIDYKEAGVSRVRFENWFKNHKIEDQQRRKRERDRKARERQEDERKFRALARKLGKKVV